MNTTNPFASGLPSTAASAPAWHMREGKDKPKGSSGIMDKMGGMVDRGVDAVGNFFDKSRSRQMIFAWIVMPAVTAIAMYFLLGAGFFHHGLAGMKNPGMQAVMGLPVVAVLAGMTIYGMVTVTGQKAPEKLRNLVQRIVRLAAFPVYMAGFSWLCCHVINMQHGFSSAHYQMQHAFGATGPMLPQVTAIGGIGNTSWMGILILGGVPMQYAMEMFVNELRSFTQEMHCRSERLKGRNSKESFEMHRLEQEAAAKSREEKRNLRKKVIEEGIQATVEHPIQMEEIQDLEIDQN